MVAPSRMQIHVSALKRLLKEHDLYLKEEEDLSAALDALKMRPTPDEYQVRKTQQVLDETRRVIPRVRQLLEEELNIVRSLNGQQSEDSEACDEAIQLSEAHLASH